MEIFNEWNLEGFVNPQKQGGQLVSPQNMVKLLSYVYPALKKEARQLGATIEIGAGALTSKHNVPAFIYQMGVATRKLKLKLGQVLFDSFNFHPYMPGEFVTQTHPTGDEIGISDLPLLESDLKKAIGYIPNINLTEFGIETTESGDQHGYKSNDGLDGNYESEQQQAQQYREALSIVSCDPNVDSFYFFHLVDVPYATSTWGRSGVLRPDNSPKPAFYALQKAIPAAIKGTLADCAQPNSPAPATDTATPR